MSNKDLLEAKQHFKNNKDYFECPHGCQAIYHIYSFTHNPFECKDCRQMFSIPKHIKLNKPVKFNKKKKTSKQGA